MGVKYQGSFNHLFVHCLVNRKAACFVCTIILFYFVSSAGLELFRGFLRSEFSDENLEFWIAVEEFKQSKPSKVSSMAQQIYTDFVAPQAPREVSHLVKEHSPSQPQLNGIHCLMDSDTANLLLHLKHFSKPISPGSA